MIDGIIELGTGDYVVGIWFVLGKGQDWMAVATGSPKKWKIQYRIHYHGSHKTCNEYCLYNDGKHPQNEKELSEEKILDLMEIIQDTVIEKMKDGLITSQKILIQSRDEDVILAKLQGNEYLDSMIIGIENLKNFKNN